MLDGYWPELFHFIDERYKTLPFPFEEVEPPEFEIQTEWELGQLAGFLDSWSATRRYQNQRGQHPVSMIWEELAGAWGEGSQRRRVRWPLYLRAGRVG